MHARPAMMSFLTDNPDSSINRRNKYEDPPFDRIFTINIRKWK
jgi:hypothetical protein